MKLIKFEQDNCTPCKMLSNFLQYDLEVDADETVNISAGTIKSNGQVTEDEGAVMELAGEFGIMKTPTLLLVDDSGAEIERFAGVGHSGVKAIFAKRGLI